MKNKSNFAVFGGKSAAPACIVFSICGGMGLSQAAEHQVSNAGTGEGFGGGIQLSGGMFIAGSPGAYWPAYDDDLGRARVFRNIVDATGTTIQSVTLNPSDVAAMAGQYGGESAQFGSAVALSGEYGLVGASADRRGLTASPAPPRGSAYFYKGLDTATGQINESVKLLSTDNTHQLGEAVFLVGDTAYVRARGDGSAAATGGSGVGFSAVYVYRNLSAASGTRTQNAKLLGSDITNDNQGFGNVSVGGNTAVVGANSFGNTPMRTGAAYVYRNINTVTGTVYENAKLMPSVTYNGANFGYSTSVSANGSVALVGANREPTGGAVYLFRGLGTATGTINESAMLVSSDRAASDSFGDSVSLSGNNAIIGAIGDDDKGSGSGSAYIYTGLGSASGTATENVKITASDGAAGDAFGYVSLDGDLFVVGSTRGDGVAADTGKAYSGTVSSLTTFDAGNKTGVIGGISFESRQKWVIGRTTDNNVVVLSEGDTANVTTTGTTVEIGEFTGANGNQLVIAGNLEANQVNIGVEQIGGNNGNSLRFESTATFDIDEIRLTPGNSLGLAPAGHNFLIIEEQVNQINALMAYLGDTDFLGTVDGGATWQQINTSNYTELIRWNYNVTNPGATTIWLIPEPSTTGLGLIGAGLLVGRRRRDVTSIRG